MSAASMAISVPPPMLVKDAAPQRLEGHKQNVPPDSEDENNCQRAREPWCGTRQMSLQIEVEKAELHGREAHGGANGGPQSARSQDPENEAAKAETHQRGQKADRSYGRVGNDRNRGDAENDREDEAPGFALQIALFVFEGPQLPGVGDRIADVAQSLQQLLRTATAGSYSTRACSCVRLTATLSMPGIRPRAFSIVPVQSEQ